MLEPCDDPYKILALYLVSSCSTAELKKMLHDAKVVKRMIVREVREADFYGPFLDCIMVGVIKSNERRKIGRTLLETADFFYNRFDLIRFRKELKDYCQKFGRDVE